MLLLVCVATLTPAVWFMPDMRHTSSLYADKWFHGITFVFLTVWFSGQYRRSSWWRLAAGMLAFGALIEVCQQMLSYRSAESLDLAADAAGVAVGLLIAWAGAGGWSLRIEQWIAARE
ncbi:MAG: VanZ family protein [Woeseia sp.]